MKFISTKYKALRIVLQPKTRRFVGGQWQIVPGTTVEFVNSVYETEDEGIIRALKRHRYYGFLIHSDEPVKDEPNPEGIKEINAKKEISKKVAERVHKGRGR